MNFQTIPKTGVVKCKCGGNIAVEMVRYSRGECEDCGNTHTTMGGRYLGILQIMEGLGFSASMDWDGELEIESDLTLTESQELFLFRQQDAIRKALTNKAKNDRMVCLGGSMDGKKHGHFGRTGSLKFFHIARMHWETYRFMDDGRLVFVGKSTSKAKAKREDYVS